MANVGAELGTGKFRHSLSVFLPAFNDAAALPALIRATIDTLHDHVETFEVIVVNDGSTDDTAQVLEGLRQHYAPWMKIVTHETNLGYGAALRSGFHAASKDYVFYTDGDGQYDPRELASLLVAAEDPQVALVNGFKRQRSDPWHRIAIGWLYNHFARWLFRIRLRDIDCDFRLIRRNALNLGELRSTGGTICVELVRSLELTGHPIVELPVSHYPRQHGRSQFFRVRSLAVTFWQLMLVFWRLVVQPALQGPPGSPTISGPTIGYWAGMVFLLTAASLAAYGWALRMPFISDDYVQIQLSREFGPVEKWSALAQDALYRCRATSLLLTNWIDRLFGPSPIYYNAASLLLHLVNSALVFALGLWKPIGWRVSALAAIFFAISQRHSEAVVWFAAVPELLVFLFVLAAFLLWVQWLEKPRFGVPLYIGALTCYVLALFSKESAVALVPLAGMAVLFQADRNRRGITGLLPFAVIGILYFAWAWGARQTHLHFNDGTFSFQAPVAEVMARSLAGLLWVWGMVTLALVVAGKLRLEARTIILSLGWMILGLAPYSFLTYMPRVPSRHTYLASVGLAILVASGFLALKDWAKQRGNHWMVPAVAALICVHQCGYLWVVQSQRYELRAEPTEKLLHVARTGTPSINASCFPYAPVLVEYAFKVALPTKPKPLFALGKESAQAPDSVNFCNHLAEGVQY